MKKLILLHVFILSLFFIGGQALNAQELGRCLYGEGMLRDCSVETSEDCHSRSDFLSWDEGSDCSATIGPASVEVRYETPIWNVLQDSAFEIEIWVKSTDTIAAFSLAFESSRNLVQIDTANWEASFASEGVFILDWYNDSTFVDKIRTFLSIGGIALPPAPLYLFTPSDTLFHLATCEISFREDSLATLYQEGQIPFHFDSTFIPPGLDFIFADMMGSEIFPSFSNDTILIRADGEAGIVLSDTVFDFGAVLIGGSAADTLTIYNFGQDTLTVNSIASDNPDFTVDLSNFVLGAYESQDVQITFIPQTEGISTGSLTIESSDTANPILTVELTGEGAFPPIISISPDSLADSLFTGESSLHYLTIENTGGSDLLWEIYAQYADSGRVLQSSPEFFSNEPASGEKTDEISPPDDPDPSELYIFDGLNIAPGLTSKSTSPELEDILENLNTNYGSITDVIPNRYNFDEGVFGYYIGDGGDDMYDGGNYLSTDLGGYIDYSDDVILASPYFGTDGRYFTRKYTGLFIIAADMQDVDYFRIDGNLGADGMGSVDGAILETHIQGRTFYGFVKRVYNANDPSVNHLVIIEADSGVNHEFSTDTNDDYHRVFNLGNIERIYYLLYAGDDGYYIDDSSTLGIMNAFLNALELGPQWISIEPDSGSLAAGASQDVSVTFDATDLFGGDYIANILILSNDPLTPEDTVPAHLNVTGAPDIVVSDDSLDYGDVFIGAVVADTLIVSNEGTDILNVSDISSDNADYSVDITSFSLNPGESQEVVVSFAPSSEGEIAAVLAIESDDPDEPTANVYLHGVGWNPPVISVSPDSLADSLFTGEQSTHMLTISNEGSHDLYFEIDIEEADTGSLKNPRDAQWIRSILEANELVANSNSSIGCNGAGVVQDTNIINLSSEEIWQLRGQNPSSNEDVIYAVVLDGNGTYYADGYVWDELNAYWSDYGEEEILIDYSTFHGVEITYAGLTASEADVIIITNNWEPSFGYGAFTVSEASAIADYVNNGATLYISAGTFNSGENPSIQTTVDYLAPLIGLADGQTFFWNDPDYQPLYFEYPNHPVLRNIPEPFASAFSYITLVPSAGTWTQAALSEGVFVAISQNDQTALIAYENRIYHSGLPEYHTATASDKQFIYNVLTLPRGPLWLSANPEMDTVSAGSSVDVEITFNAEDMNGGDYYANILILSNDPLTPEDTVPAHLHVTGAPDIVVSDDSLDYGDVFIGAVVVDTLIVSNAGTDVLNVSDISSDNADYSADITSFSLNPGEGQEVVVSFAPSSEGEIAAVLAIESDDPDEPTANVYLHGVGWNPPVISVSPDSLADSLFTGEQSTHMLTVSNEGSHDLYFEIDIEEADTGSLKNPRDAQWIRSILEANELVANAGNSFIPEASGDIQGTNPTDLSAEEIWQLRSQNPSSNGDVVYAVVLDGIGTNSPGNRLWDDLNAYWSDYGEEEILIDYSTFHDIGITYAGLAASEADVIIISNNWNSYLYYVASEASAIADYVNEGAAIYISAGTFNNGEYSELQPHVDYLAPLVGLDNSQTFYWNNNTYQPLHFEQPDHPVLRDITEPFSSGYTSTTLVPSSGTWTDAALSEGTFVAISDNDQTAVIVNGDRVYHSSLPEHYTATQSDMQFMYNVLILEGGLSWLSANPEVDTVSAGSSVGVEITFNAEDMNGGDYYANILISSNDPLTPQDTVPAYLHVTGAPDIAVSDDSLDYGDVFIGAVVEDTLIVSNAGTDILNVSDISSDNADYSVDITSFSLNPNESQEVVVSFAPSSEGEIAAVLAIESDDPDESTVNVHLHGVAWLPPEITVNPESLSDSLLSGKTAKHLLTIANDGVSDLDFRITVETIAKYNAGGHAKPEPGGGGNHISTSSNSQPYNNNIPPLRGILEPGDIKIPHTKANDIEIAFLVSGGDPSEMQTLLSSFPHITSVDVIDAEDYVPPLADLLAYQSIIVSNSRVFEYAEEIGDLLADYVDAGGGVVMTVASFAQGFEIQGRLVDEGYLPFNIGYGPIGSASLGYFNPDHPIMEGVTDAEGDLLVDVTLSSGAELVASWNTGNPFIATKGSNVAAVNIFFASPGYWLGDIPLILRNAAFWSVGGSSWLSAEPVTGTISQGDSRIIEVTYDATDLELGEYYADIIISSNDPLQPAVVVNNFLHVLDSNELVTPTNEWIDIYCAEPELDGVPLSAGDIINAYDPDGILCGQAIVQEDGSYGFMPIYRDDSYSENDEGAEPGDTIWFSINGVDVSNDPAIIWTHSGARYELCQFSGTICRPIHLREGWNLISWNVAYESPIEDLISAFSEYIDVIQGFEQGALTYDPELPQHSTLEYLDYHYGYWFKMDSAYDFEICAEGIGKNDLIDINEGWNLIGYWPRRPYAVEDALASILENVLVVLGFDEGGGSVWVPTLRDFNNLTEMEPLLGYWLKSAADDFLSFPGFNPPGDKDLFAKVSREQSAIFPSNKWVSVYGTAIKLDGVEIESGTIIEAYSESGTKCGESQYSNGILKFMPVYGCDDWNKVTREYPQSGERFSIHINGKRTYPDVVWSDEGMRIDISQRFGKSEGSSGNIPTTYALEQNFPNPFNPNTEISYAIPEASLVKLEIFNIMGQKVIALVNEYQEAGNYTVTWDGMDGNGNEASSGVYFYRITVGDFASVKKMVLVK